MSRPLRLLALLAALCAAASAQAQGRAAGVQTDVVALRSVAETVPVFGQVVSGRESRVAARVAGVAVDVPVRVGDRVVAGAVLARVDTERLEIELDQARAELEVAEAGVAVAEAQLDRATKAFRRAETLRQNATIAEAQLEDRAGDYAGALGALRQAEARIAVARAALRGAEYNFANAAVTAPFDGVVLAIATEEGQFVNAGSEVATLLDAAGMEVEANVPARYVPALTPGLAVEARTESGAILRLTLRSVLPQEFSATRTRPVRFDVADGGPETALAQSLTLAVPVSAPREAVVVPKDALVQGRGGGWSVFVNDRGVAQPRPVEIGQAVAGGFEVLAGLVPGDEVVVRGNERLRPGQEIAPMGGGPGGPPAQGPAPGNPPGQGGRDAAAEGAPQGQEDPPQPGQGSAPPAAAAEGRREGAAPAPIPAAATDRG